MSMIDGRSEKNWRQGNECQLPIANGQYSTKDKEGSRVCGLRVNEDEWLSPTSMDSVWTRLQYLTLTEGENSE